MRRLFTLLLILIYALTSRASDKIYTTTRVTGTIKIDGRLDDAAWKSATIGGDFTQNEPVQGASITQRTEVRMMYDNTSIYIGAMMYDTHPDSILHQLGNRDEVIELNADAFRIGIDPYNQRQEGYVFDLSASGVQAETFNMDPAFDAVWESAARINDSGWVAEIRIPYSAIRFPDSPSQTWGLQFSRLIRRNREYDQWSLVRKDIRNPMIDWGTLTGIQDIHPPVRLSITPYISFYDENAPVYNNQLLDHYENSYSYAGGADLKLGLNESFTLDLTLLPDFSQVQSDNKVKNLTAYEQIFEENRPFFKEGTSLFETGKLFYSRRIGRTPSLFYSVTDSLLPGEELIRNPTTAHLINATKVSGRTNAGLGIGILNAVTGNTYATLQREDGATRSVLTEPLSNYSMLVLDQQLKNNSRIWFVNSNTMRDGANRDANVYSTGLSLENKIHSFRLSSRYANSHVWDYVTVNNSTQKEDKSGHQLSMSLDKISGVMQYGSSFEFGDKNFDKNDLGYIFINDYSDMNVYASYNKYNPFWKIFRQGSLDAYIYRGGKWSLDNQLTSFGIGSSIFLLFNNNWSFYMNYNRLFVDGRDWFEPRVDGRYYRNPKYAGVNIDCSTNYNWPLAFNYGVSFGQSPEIDSRLTVFFIEPMIRFNDHFSVRWKSEFMYNRGDRGFCTYDSVYAPVFGRRDINTIVNRITSRYQFNPKTSIALNLRHYWSQGTYDHYFQLEKEGTLSDYGTGEPSNLPFNTDFNTNYFNVDLVFSWLFSPGSSLILTYKNQVSSDNSDVTQPYLQNLSNTLNDPQTTSFTLKVLYFLDYERIHERLTGNRAVNN